MNCSSRILLLSLVQAVLVSKATGQSWKSTDAPAASWRCTASSANGTKMVAGVYGGGIYRSTNSGLNWVLSGAPAKQWRGLACSTNGNKMAAAIYGERIFTSIDSGLSWQQSSAPATNWNALVSSADGSKLAAVVGGIARIHTSQNSGTNWTTTGAPATNWSCIASSADGTRLIAGCIGSGLILSGSAWISANSGVNWTITGPPNLNYTAVASSGDGKRLALAGSGASGFGTIGPSQIYISTNSGASWNPASVPTLPSPYVSSLASSPDGKYLAASYQSSGGIFGGSGGAVVTSTDFGVTWNSNSPNVPFISVTSADGGSELLAAVPDGSIYRWQYQPMLRSFLEGTNFVVRWAISPWVQGFHLHQNADLYSTNWSLVNAPVASDGTNQSVALPKAASRLFYRLKK